MTDIVLLYDESMNADIVSAKDINKRKKEAH